jgi:regulatory protein
VEKVVSDLAAQGLLDDARFAQLWADSRVASKPRSSATIRRELVFKGVSRDLAEAAIGDIDDRENAYRAGLKLARRLGGSDFPTFRRRLWGYLMRRGFSQSLARHTVTRLWDERSNFDSTH